MQITISAGVAALRPNETLDSLLADVSKTAPAYRYSDKEGLVDGVGVSRVGNRQIRRNHHNT